MRRSLVRTPSATTEKRQTGRKPPCHPSKNASEETFEKEGREGRGEGGAYSPLWKKGMTALRTLAQSLSLCVTKDDASVQVRLWW